MKTTLALAVLLSAWMLTPAPAHARVGCSSSFQSTEFIPGNTTLALAPGASYTLPVTSNAPLGPHYSFCVTYTSMNCAPSISPADYFPVTVTYNNTVYQPINEAAPNWFIPTSGPQTMSINLDLADPTFAKCNPPPGCVQTIQVDVSFSTNMTCTACSNDRGQISFLVNLADHSIYSMDVKNGEVFYVAGDHHLHSLKWNGTAWTPAAITPANGGWGAVSAEGWVTASPTGGNVFFKAGGNMLYNLYSIAGTWYMDALSYSVNNVRGFIRPKGSRVYYVGTDCRIHYFEWNGSAWVINAINPLNGWANRLVRGAMDVSQVNEELFYRSDNGAVYRLFLNGAGQWDHELLVSSGSAGNLTVDPQTNDVYFKGSDTQVHRLRLSGLTWQHQTLTASNGSYQVLGYLTKFPGEDRVFYTGVDGLLHNLYFSSGAWFDFPLSYTVGPVVGNALAAEAKLFYFHGDNAVHNFLWAGTQWVDGALAATAPNVSGCVNVDRTPCAGINPSRIRPRREP